MSLLCDKCTGTGRLRSIGGLNKECDQCFGTKVFIAKAEEKVEEKVIDMKEAEVNETLEKVVEIENKTVKRGRKKLDEVLKKMGKIDEHAA